MVLLTSRPPRAGQLLPQCARCLSLAARSSTISTSRRHHAPVDRHTTATSQRRSYTRATRSKKEREEKGVNPSEPFDPPPDEPLPADGKHIAIIGGGLTGLTAAYYMAGVVRPSTKITLYEASSRLGGWVKTDQVPVNVDGKKGIVNFERGPRSLSSLAKNKSRFDDLMFYDLCIKLGLRPSVTPALPRYIYYPDHIVPVPDSMYELLRTLSSEQLWFETALSAGFGYLKHAWKGKPFPHYDMSITEFVDHVAGGNPSIPGNLASAMIHGIYGGDIDRLSARWALYPAVESLCTMPKCPEDHFPTTQADLWTLASFVGDPAVRKMAGDVADKRGTLLHFGSDGLEALPKALESALRGQENLTIKTSSAPRKLEYLRNERKIKLTEKTGTVKKFDKVYSTVNAQELKRLVPGKLKALEDFESVSIMAVNLWFPKPNLKPPGFGYLIPRSVSQEENPHHALGVFFDSDIGNNHPEEPEGTKLFVLMGGHHYDKPGVKIPTPEEAIQQARETLEIQLGISKSLPCHAEANFSKNCIPQHNVGHDYLLTDLHAQLVEEFEGRLSPTGGSFTRIGGMAAIRDGWHAGINGLDPTKPLPRHMTINGGWEQQMSLLWFLGRTSQFVGKDMVGPARPAIFPDMRHNKLHTRFYPDEPSLRLFHR